jgi:hypothetical protein
MDKALLKLKELKNIYQQTQEFEVGKELKVKLKLLTSEDETEVHNYSVQYEQGISYLYAVKRETLSRAIIAMNGTNIPEVVEDDNEKVQRHVWIRENIVSGWSQLLVDQIWNFYAVLIEKAEENITGGIRKEEMENNE